MTTMCKSGTIALAIGLILIGTGAGVTLTTPVGKLVIDSKDADVKIAIIGDNEKIRIIDSATDGTVELAVGNYGLRLVDEKLNYQLESDSFTLRRGERVVVNVQLVRTKAPTPTKPAPQVTDQIETSPLAWSKIISADTIEEEMEAIKLAVDAQLTTHDAFRTHGYKSCRLLFARAAMLFGIIGRYDAEARWQQVANHGREQFARAAANCKSGSLAAYQQAKLKQQLLADIVGGDRTPAGRREFHWADVVDRVSLMQGMHAIHRQVGDAQDSLSGEVADEIQLAAGRRQLVRHAELLAATATVLHQPGMQNTDDQEYADLAHQLAAHAGTLADRARNGTRVEVGRAKALLTNTCSRCHESYR